MSKQIEIDFEAKGRDDALELLEQHRSELIGRAKEIAFDLATRNGTVTSPEVVKILKSEDAPQIHEVDLRFMGCVFRKGWTRVKFANKGSHKQPISVWALKCNS